MKHKLIVAVTGGRTYNNYNVVEKALSKITAKFDATFIQGGALGADHQTRLFCVLNNVDYRTYDADWDTLGDAAGHIRNQEMIDNERIDLLIAFPGNGGTRDMVARCSAAGIKIKLIEG